MLRADVVMVDLRASFHRVSINFLVRRRQSDVATTFRSPRPMMNTTSLRTLAARQPDIAHLAATPTPSGAPAKQHVLRFRSSYG